MLASDAPDAPLKAVDFGLAVFFEPGELPRRDLGFEGTPWFMAPEVRGASFSLSASSLRLSIPPLPPARRSSAPRSAPRRTSGPRA
jgi:hypothetical protein